jgi:hypothetical protein
MTATAAARRLPEPAHLDDAVVVGAEIVAGHDGAAELLVWLRHGNGATSHVTLDAATGFDLMRAGRAASLDGLVGQSWRPLIKEL